MNQSVQPELKNIISETVLPFVCKCLSPDGTSPSRYARTLDCFEVVTEELKSFDTLPFTLIKESDENENEISKLAKQEKIEKAISISSETWFAVVKWAKANNKFTPIERRQLYTYGVMKQNGRVFSFKQSCNGLDLLNEAELQGFNK